MSSATPTDRLLDDLRQVVEDTEALLRATAGQAGERAQEARSRAEDSLRQARVRLEGLEQEVVTRARDAAHEADRYVHANPWQSIGIAAGVAFVLGLLVSRR
jgi:ElaB/YqjD/DUF883 family membrane-anchored ribosome-binding protein